MTVTNTGDATARDRAHQLRRDRARAARRRPGAPGVREPVRRDRVARLVYRDHRDAAPALGAGADALVRARGGRRPGAGRAGRPARPIAPASSAAGRTPRDPAALDAGGPLVGDDRRRARSGVRAARRGCGWSRGSRRRSRSPRWWPPRASGPSSWPTATTIPTPPSARSTSPGPRRRWSCASWASRRGRRRVPGAGRPSLLLQPRAPAPPGGAARATGLAAAALVHRRLGRLADPARDRSSRRKACRRCASSSRRTTTGGGAGMMVDLVVLNSAAAELLPGAGAADHGRDSRVADAGRGGPARRRIPPAPRPARARGARDAPRHGAGAPGLRWPRARARSWRPAPPRTSGTEDLAALPARAGRRAARPQRVRAVRIAERCSGPARRGLRPDAHGADRAARSAPAGAEAGRARAPCSATGSARPTAEGDYEIRVDGGRVPPAPWANVIANPQGGFLVTERGAGFTWAGSSYFYRLTPWHNDPVSDPAERSAVPAGRGERRAAGARRPRPSGRGPLHRAARRRASTTFEHERDGIATTLVLGLAETPR